MPSQNMMVHSKIELRLLLPMGRLLWEVVQTQWQEIDLRKKFVKPEKMTKFKAIVLRVNSPGGSLTASDIIWREVMLTKGVKPIIASMGDVAASGGYFISMPCDTIIAQANTITGSIGIFGIIPNFENLLENKLGITSDQVKIGEYSDIATVSRKLNEQERAIIQKGVEAGYDTFISKAAAGRNLPEEDILKVASGRVWTGEQALERGLIDMIGDLDDAIELAARKAGLEEGNYKVKSIPRAKRISRTTHGRYGCQCASQNCQILPWRSSSIC